MGYFLLSLGLVVLMFWSLQQAQAALAASLHPWRKRWLWNSSTTGLIPLLREQLMLVALEPSVRANRVQALTAQLFRLRTWRANLMWFCFSVLGMAFWLIPGLAFLKVSGLYVLAVGGVLLFAANLWRKGREISLTVLYVGLFLFAAEQWLRVHAGAGMAEVSWWMTWTTDGRPGAVFLMMIVGLVAGAVLRMEGLSFVVSLAGLATGFLSLNGAVMLWAGERAGLGLSELWTSRGWPKGPRSMVTGLAVASVVGVVIGWLVLGWARTFLGDFGSLGAAHLVTRLEGFFMLSVIVEIPVVVLTMVWGHFVGKTTPDDVLQTTHLERSWFHQSGLRTPTLKLLRAGLMGRVDEIERLRTGFEETNWKDVPVFVKNASNQERETLAATLKTLDADLLSRSEFFGHQWR